jgi:hypothetical protein
MSLNLPPTIRPVLQILQGLKSQNQSDFAQNQSDFAQSWKLKRYDQESSLSLSPPLPLSLLPSLSPPLPLSLLLLSMRAPFLDSP